LIFKLTNTLALTLVLAVMLSPATQAGTLAIGLQTYHFDRDVKPDECRNETHSLVGYEANNILAGTYINTHCRRSYFLGYSKQLYKGIGFDIDLVSGYPEYLQSVAL